MSSIQGNKYFVYVNSRNRASGTDSNFTYNIQMPDDNHNFDRVVLINALIPKSFYLIQEGYNVFELKENAATVTITVPSGCYLLGSFQNKIGALLTAASPNGLTYTVTYPSQAGADTGKFTYTQNNALISSSLIFNGTLFEPFGFLPNSINAFNGTTLISTTVIKMQAEDRLLIHSDIVNNPGGDDILVSINSTSNINFSSIVYTEVAPEFASKVLNSDKISTYRFTLTDENSQLIDTNGLNINFTLMFYKKDRIYEQLRDFMKMLIDKKII